MLQQKNGVGKTAVFVIGIIVTGIFLLASWGLPLAITQSQFDNHNYLPVVLKEADSTPTPTNTATATSTLTPTNTPTLTPTPDTCGLEIEEAPYVDSDFVSVTGEIGRLVTVTDVTTGATLGSGTLLASGKHACLGFLKIPLSSLLIFDHLILVESDNPHDQFDTAWVKPPPLPPIPTAGSTATPDFCGLKFGATPAGGFAHVEVTGEIGRVVTIIDRTTNRVLGSDQLAQSSTGWSTCPGYAQIALNEVLIEGHLLLAESNDPYDHFDAAWVSSPPPLPTPGVSPTPTSTATPTPTEPFIYLQPNCGSPPDVQFTIQGFNWPQDETVALYWASSQLQSVINTGNQTSFSQTWQKYGITNGTYEVVAVSDNHTATAVFTAPCPLPPTNTPTPTATATAGPVNLIIGRPILVSTPPIVAYQPIEFQVSIFNAETAPVDSPFFVDIYLDPTTIFMNGIPLHQSGGYQSVSSIPGLATRVLTITAPLGFQNEPIQHTAYSMVDSLGQIQEIDETDNVSVPLLISSITPAPTPTATSTPPSGLDALVGIVYRPTNEGLIPLLRANVTLIDAASSETIATTISDPATGSYSFQNLPPGKYAVTACGSVESGDEVVLYAGWRTNVTLPGAFPVNIYTESSLNCPN